MHQFLASTLLGKEIKGAADKLRIVKFLLTPTRQVNFPFHEMHHSPRNQVMAEILNDQATKPKMAQALLHADELCKVC